MRNFTSTLFHDSQLGVRIQLNCELELEAVVRQLEADPQMLLEEFHKARGLMVVESLDEVELKPELLLRISRLFGHEVENYKKTPTPSHMIHKEIPEILLLSNLPPCERPPPPKPNPPLTIDGKLPTRFPHRRGWHTDQSFRRPPPDVSLFYAVIPSPLGQGQTLFADGIAAYRNLPPNLRTKIRNMDGLHALLGTGRSEQAVRAGEPIQKLLPHQESQRQPLVRTHPVTGENALYLCEAGQMDWHEGPIIGLEPGVNGAGARLVYELMAHYTKSEHTYVHEWQKGDLVIYDNRCLIHAATWYDSDKHTRLMWRTTVSGNPGTPYVGETKSWLPEDGTDFLEGLGDGRWESATKLP